MKKGIITIISIAFLTAALLWSFQAAEAGDIKGRIKIKSAITSSDILVYIDGVENGGKTIGKINVHSPHVSVAFADSKVDFFNDDEVAHNIYSTSEGNRFNLGVIKPGATKSVTFKKPGLVEVKCNTHEDMENYIWVLEKAVWSVTDKRGRFKLTGVPEGKQTVKVWHPDLGETSVQVEVPAEEPARLRIDYNRETGFQVREARASVPRSGKLIVQKYECQACHKIGGQGGSIGPKLDSVVRKRGKDYVAKFVKNPKSDIMPVFNMSDEEIRSLVSYLEKIGK